MAESATLPFLSGGGAMGARLRGFDWAASGFGAPETWPAELRTAVSLCLDTSVPTAIYWGPELRLIYNEAWSPIAGEKHPWALGRPAREVWADIWHVIEPQLRQVVESGEAFTVADQPLPMERGGRVQQTHWDYSFAPIRAAGDGRVLGIFNQGNETTGRIEAERALRASEQRLEYALGASDTVGTWDWDVPNDTVTSDARFARLYGVDPALAAQGAPIATFFRSMHPGDRERVREAVDTALATGEPMRIEYRLVQPDGSVRWVVADGRCTRAPDGTPLRFPGVSFDITPRKAMEAALRESEARFRAIANSVDQMIWSTTPDGYHDYYNQRWYDFTGVPEGSTDGEEWNGMFHPDDQARAWQVWSHSLATGEAYHIEYRLRHRSGAYRWVLGRAQPVRDGDGEIVRWFGSCTDIQEITDAREVLARSRVELERAVEARSAELMLAEEQLRQSQKMEAVGQLTGGIAHDFNNMLAVVLGSLHLLERKWVRGDTDLERWFEAARDGANRAANLTQRLLAFSRRQPLSPEVVDPGEMVRGMTEILARTLGEHIRMQTHLATDPWCVHADPSQLENAILNLAVNARDAMPHGGRLTIATRNRHVTRAAAEAGSFAPGDYVEIAVSDDGVGMPSEVAAKAFDPFFTTKGVGKGTGLGLSQVFGFVSQSGGHATIASAVGEGTTVTLLLPRHEREVPAAEAAGAQASVQRASSGRTVLVVEDEERVRRFSVEALRELGFTVIEADGGEAALRLIHERPEIDLLFTDLVMPGMTGGELAAAARRERPGLGVLYTTGYAREATRESGMLGRGFEVLQKPFSLEQLQARITAVLGEG